MRRNPMLNPRSPRRTFSAQGQDFANKAAADMTIALGTHLLAGYFCTLPSPDYALCYALNEIADEQAKKFSTSALNLGVWGCVAVLVAVCDDIR